jgi:hypothetical protein
MNLSDSAQLREKWGDKPCHHPLIEAETEAGHPSMNYVCTTCGKVGVGDLWNTPTGHYDSPGSEQPMNTQMPDIPERTPPPPPPRPEGPPTPKQDKNPKPKSEPSMPPPEERPGTGTKE